MTEKNIFLEAFPVGTWNLAKITRKAIRVTHELTSFVLALPPLIEQADFPSITHFPLTRIFLFKMWAGRSRSVEKTSTGVTTYSFHWLGCAE